MIPYITIVAILVFLFIIYVIYQRNRAKVINSKSDKIVISKEIIGKYAEAIAKQETFAKKISLLENSKDEIINSFQIYIPFLWSIYNEDDEETLRVFFLGNKKLAMDSLLSCYSLIDEFIEDSEAIVINKYFTHYSEMTEDEKIKFMIYSQEIINKRDIRFKEFAAFKHTVV